MLLFFARVMLLSCVFFLCSFCACVLAARATGHSRPRLPPSPFFLSLGFRDWELGALVRRATFSLFTEGSDGVLWTVSGSVPEGGR